MRLQFAEKTSTMNQNTIYTRSSSKVSKEPRPKKFDEYNQQHRLTRRPTSKESAQMNLRDLSASFKSLHLIFHELLKNQKFMAEFHALFEGVFRKEISFLENTLESRQTAVSGREYFELLFSNLRVFKQNLGLIVPFILTDVFQKFQKKIRKSKSPSLKKFKADESNSKEKSLRKVSGKFAENYKKKKTGSLKLVSSKGRSKDLTSKKRKLDKSLSMTYLDTNFKGPLKKHAARVPSIWRQGNVKKFARKPKSKELASKAFSKNAQIRKSKEIEKKMKKLWATLGIDKIFNLPSMRKKKKGSKKKDRGKKANAKKKKKKIPKKQNEPIKISKKKLFGTPAYEDIKPKVVLRRPNQNNLKSNFEVFTLANNRFRAQIGEANDTHEDTSEPVPMQSKFNKLILEESGQSKQHSKTCTANNFGSSNFLKSRKIRIKKMDQIHSMDKIQKIKEGSQRKFKKFKIEDFLRKNNVVKLSLLPSAEVRSRNQFNFANLKSRKKRKKNVLSLDKMLRKEGQAAKKSMESKKGRKKKESMAGNALLSLNSSLKMSKKGFRS